jgi:hypothetical protein
VERQGREKGHERSFREGRFTARTTGVLTPLYCFGVS